MDRIRRFVDLKLFLVAFLLFRITVAMPITDAEIPATVQQLNNPQKCLNTSVSIKHVIRNFRLSLFKAAGIQLTFDKPFCNFSNKTEKKLPTSGCRRCNRESN